MAKSDIRNLTRAQLEEALREAGGEAYRARQVWRWLYKVGAASFEEMTDIPEGLRAKLASRFSARLPALLDRRSSALDGTEKYLLKLADGNTIEAVFIPEAGRATVCISSQVGCRFRCAFCASSAAGFIRNLDPAEMLGEVLFVKSSNPGAGITNIVFMGIGEPFDNYDNVLKAIRVLNDRDAFDIGARRITVSTCGIIPGIERLKAEDLQVELSVSLHSADGKVRSRVVPANKAYPLAGLIKACRDYTRDTNRVITFEYVLLKGINSSKADAGKLAKLLRGMKCKVNAIAYNQVKALGYEKPDTREIKSFMQTLKARGASAMLRKSRGEDIDAGCGQLRIVGLAEGSMVNGQWSRN